jgi:indole-3-glycerol phosphate synthase
MGADAVLLIVAALSDAVLSECLDAAQQLGMTVLVEVHDAAELAQALKHQPRLVGINNRNLKTLKTDLSTTLTLAPTVQGDITLVAESGLKSAQDLAACRRIGVHSFLIGEHLLRQPNPGLGLRELLGGGG